MTTANDLITAAQTYAQNAQNAAVSAMSGAAAALNGLGRTISIDPFKNVSLAIKPPDPGDPGEVPLYTGSHFNVDDPFTFIGDVPTLSQIAPITLPNDIALPPPDLLYVEPMVPTGTSPDYSLLSGIPTIDALPTLPVMPDLQGEIQGITAPVLLPIDIPDAPVYVAPEFDGVAPSFDAEVPTDLDLQMRASYSDIAPVFAAAVSNQFDAFLAAKFPGFAPGMAAIETRLATYLAGGSALTPAVEDAMMGRARARTNTEARRASQEIIKKGARAGFTIPGPVILSQLQDIDQHRRNENVKVAIEIYVKQAELEQTNLQFAVKQSSELRKIAIDASLEFYRGMVQINAQSLDFARATVDAIVKAFDVAARFAETQARIYEADAQVYRAKLEGALANIHVFTELVRAEEAKANTNRAAVDAYTARINAVKAEADVYRASVDAVVSLAGLERIKVELYDAKVHAFGSQVNAFTAQWQGYEAAVKGQNARMEVNVAHSREYEARANAYTATVNGKARAYEAALDGNKLLVDVFKARVQSYEVLEHAKAEAVQIDVGAYRATLDAFVAKANAISEKSKSEVAVYDVALRGLIAEANIIIEEMKEFNHLDIVRAQGLATISESLSAQFGKLAEAAMSGMNSLAADVVTETP